MNTRLRKFRTYLTRPNNRLRLTVIFGSCHCELSSLRRSLPTMAARDGRAIAKRPTRLALLTFWPLCQKLRSAEFAKPCIQMRPAAGKIVNAGSAFGSYRPAAPLRCAAQRSRQGYCSPQGCAHRLKNTLSSCTPLRRGRGAPGRAAQLRSTSWSSPGVGGIIKPPFSVN